MRRAATNQQGAALLIVFFMALICAIASYAILAASMAQSYHARFWRQRTDARYLAEAGMVLARERLLANPNYTGGTEVIDGVGVRITVAGAANTRQTISAAVNYQ